MGPGNCLPPTPFDAQLTGTYAADLFPLTLEFSPSPGGPVLFKSVFQAPGETARTALPPNCAHHMRLVDKNRNVIATWPAWSPPVGSTNTVVKLPI
jgi:hypothetical protein